MLLALLIPGAVNSIMLIIVIFMLAGVALDNIIYLTQYMNVVLFNMMYQGLNAIGVYNSY